MNIGKASRFDWPFFIYSRLHLKSFSYFLMLQLKFYMDF